MVRKKLATDPAVAFQRSLLEIRAQSCLKQGELQDAFACADLLENVELQVQILGNLGSQQAQELTQRFLTEAASTEPYKSVKFDFRRYLTNKHNAKKLLKKPAEQQINKLILAYDEVPFTYVC